MGFRAISTRGRQDEGQRGQSPREAQQSGVSIRYCGFFVKDLGVRKRRVPLYSLHTLSTGKPVLPPRAVLDISNLTFLPPKSPSKSSGLWSVPRVGSKVMNCKVQEMDELTCRQKHVFLLCSHLLRQPPSQHMDPSPGGTVSLAHPGKTPWCPFNI